MAKKNGYRTGGGYKVGYGYQIAPPYDIWVESAMGDPRQPTTDLIDYQKNLNIWSMKDFGFGDGIEYPKAKNMDDEGPK